MGCDVHIIALFSGEAMLPFEGKLTKLNRPVSNRFTDIAGWKELADYIRDFNPDVVQANAGDTLKFAVLFKLIFRWRSPVIFRNASKVSDFINSWPKFVFNKLIMGQVTQVISVSELCRLDILSTYSLRSDKSTTVPIGIELAAVDSSVQGGLETIFNSGKVLIHVGSFVPEKNHIGLLSITQKLLQRGEDIKLILVGDGKLREYIEQQITERNLTDRIFLAGYRSDVLSIVRHAHLFVLPSKIEGLPGVILEAMYSRVPVVAYNVGGISEVIKTGETGWLIPADDEEMFAIAIQEVLHSVDLSGVTDRAYSTVVNEYDNRIIAKRFLDVYRRIA